MPTPSCAPRCSATSRPAASRSSTRSPAPCCAPRRATASNARRSSGSRPWRRAALRASERRWDDPAAMRPAKLLFWASSALIVHTHVGYPALLWLLARGRGQPAPETGATPRVSVVVAAYDEEDVIARKVENVLALDYRRGRRRRSWGPTAAATPPAGPRRAPGAAARFDPHRAGKCG